MTSISQTASRGALAGLTVMDFTQIAAGPVCTMMLADRGADVIKIEGPAGDLGRTLGPPWIAGHGTVFLSLNRNKRSVVLDLKDAEHLGHARQLIAKADIVVESFRPGVMDRLGLGYAAVSRKHPGLIYCSVSAYGQNSPFKSKPGVDGIIQGASGLMSVTGAADGAPAKVQAPIVDMITGMLATTSILDALMVRARTSQGAWLDISMYEAAIQLQQTGLASYLASGELPVPRGSAAPYSAPNEAYPTLDGWVMVAAYQPKRWRAFCQILGLDALADDERFATSDLRVANREALFEQVAAKTRQWLAADLLAAFEGGDIICGPVARYDEVVASPPFVHAALTSSFTHPEAGEVQVIGPLSNGLSGAYRSDPMRPAPLLGEHTAEVLAALVNP